jgi:hypothetical protein
MVKLPSMDELAESFSKLSPRHPPWILDDGQGKANLISALLHYPILEVLVSNLRGPRELYRLARTCKTIHRTLNLDDGKSRMNVLCKFLCRDCKRHIRTVAETDSEKVSVEYMIEKLDTCFQYSDYWGTMGGETPSRLHRYATA